MLMTIGWLIPFVDHERGLEEICWVSMYFCFQSLACSSN